MRQVITNEAGTNTAGTNTATWNLGTKMNAMANCAQVSANGQYCTRCAFRFYNYNGVCNKVSDQCKSWSDTTGACTDCYDGYALQGGDCLFNLIYSSPVFHTSPPISHESSTNYQLSSGTNTFTFSPTNSSSLNSTLSTSASASASTSTSAYFYENPPDITSSPVLNTFTSSDSFDSGSASMTNYTSNYSDHKSSTH